MKINLSYDDVSGIVKESKLDVDCNQQYRLLYRKYLKDLWDSQINHQVFFSIAISPEAVSNLNFENLVDKLKIVVKRLANYNFIKINNLGDILETSFLEGDTKKIKNKICELSEIDYIFFFGEEGITRFIHGYPYNDRNIFYSRNDRMKYKEKKDISKINEVIDNYSRQFLTQQINYMALFADNSTLKQIDVDYTKRNILRNKPEHYMRDQLCQYLTDNMRYTFTIEPELGQTKRELDIYFDVSGELYFIEIKWLGVSINDSGTGLSRKHGLARAKKGVVQALEYIDELLNSSEKSLRQGYLLIYDARDKKTELDFESYSFVEKKLEKYLNYFSILKVISLEKKHSS